MVKLIWRNRGREAAWTAATQVGSLPASHLADPIRSRVWRSTALTGQWIRGDLGAAQTVQGLALVNANLTPAAVVTVRGKSTDVWTGVDGFRARFIPWTATITQIMLIFFAASPSFRYWRIDLDDPTNPDGYIQVGVPFLGPTLQLDSPPTTFRYGRPDPSLVGYAPSGTPHVYDLDTYTTIECAIRGLSQSQLLGDVQTAFTYFGRRFPVIVSFYPGEPRDTPMAIDTNLYAHLVNSAVFGEDFPNRYAVPLQFREAK